MDKSTEQKLVDAIFGEHFGDGLDQLARGWYWQHCPGYNGKADREHMKDSAGNWFVAMFEYDYTEE